MAARDGAGLTPWDRSMARGRHTPEQIIRKLREADRMLGEGSSSPVDHGPQLCPMSIVAALVSAECQGRTEVPVVAQNPTAAKRVLRPGLHVRSSIRARLTPVSCLIEAVGPMLECPGLCLDC